MNGHEFKSILSGKNTLHRKHVDMARKTWPDYITAAFGAENQNACLFVKKSVSNLKSRNKNDARNHYAARPDGLPLGLAARRARGRAVECGSAALWRPAPWRATGHRQLARCKDVANCDNAMQTGRREQRRHPVWHLVQNPACWHLLPGHRRLRHPHGCRVRRPLTSQALSGFSQTQIPSTGPLVPKASLNISRTEAPSAWSSCMSRTHGPATGTLASQAPAVCLARAQALAAGPLTSQAPRACHVRKHLPPGHRSIKHPCACRAQGLFCWALDIAGLIGYVADTSIFMRTKMKSTLLAQTMNANAGGLAEEIRTRRMDPHDLGSYIGQEFYRLLPFLTHVARALGR